MTIRIRAVIDDAVTKDALRKARRNARNTIRDTMRRVGEAVVLPDARAGAHVGHFTNDIIIKARGTTAFLTASTLKAGRINGLFEFGGVVRGRITPRKKRGRRGHAPALGLPGGPRAAVNTPRKYHGRHFLTNAVEDNVDVFERQLLHELLQDFAPLPTSGA